MFSSWKLFKTVNPETDLDALLAITLMRISQAVKWAMCESFHTNPKPKLRGEFILQLDYMEITTGQRECLVTLGLGLDVQYQDVQCARRENSVCYMSSGLLYRRMLGRCSFSQIAHLNRSTICDSTFECILLLGENDIL